MLLLPATTRANFCAVKLTSFVAFEQLNMPNVFVASRERASAIAAVARSRASSQLAGRNAPPSRTSGSVNLAYRFIGGGFGRLRVWPGRKITNVPVEGVQRAAGYATLDSTDVQRRRWQETTIGPNKPPASREEIGAVDLSNTIVYAQGDFCRYEEAKVGLLTHGLQYGTGCFEGIRGYWVPQEEELYLVLLRDHFERLATSAKILTMSVERSVDELIEITIELCVRNRFASDVYVRPFVYKAAEDVGVRLHNVPDALAIVPIPFTPYLDASRGLHVCVSSWRRADDTMAPPRAKITGLYVNSALAKSEAVENGYDEAILLSHDGHVAEGSAENVFLVRRGVLYTPDPSQNVLEGCTRRMIMDVAQQEFGLEVIERSIDRGELYAAEEVFFTGTAAGIAHVSTIDRRVVGDGTMGPIARRLSDFYGRIVTGREPRYSHWITRAYGSSRLAAADGIR
jgi:branched-chain amino acid aminotransferase